jgi:nucleoside-diphosphate-sugar epimerase
MIYRSVAVRAAACYVGQGLNTYSHVHIDDVTRLFTLALQKGRPGGLYHAVAGEVPKRWIAERVADDLGVRAPARSAPSGNWAGTPSAPTCCP